MKLSNVNHIGIVGTGMIGASMALLFTGNGYKTTLYAINDKEAAAGMDRYDAYARDLLANGLVTEHQIQKCKDFNAKAAVEAYDDFTRDLRLP